jgi:hypothetical protein
MYSTNSILVTILAVTIGLVAVAISVRFLSGVVGKIAGEKKGLIQVVVFGFACLLSVYVVDKIVAFKINILSEAESVGIFNFVKDTTLLVFGFYFGSKNKEDN